MKVITKATKESIKGTLFMMESEDLTWRKSYDKVTEVVSLSKRWQKDHAIGYSFRTAIGADGKKYAIFHDYSAKEAQ